MYVDPSGHFIEWFIIGGAILGTWIGGSLVNQTMAFWNWDYASFDTWAGMITGGIIGGAVGFVAGAMVEGTLIETIAGLSTYMEGGSVVVEYTLGKVAEASVIAGGATAGTSSSLAGLDLLGTGLSPMLSLLFDLQADEKESMSFDEYMCKYTTSGIPINPNGVYSIPEAEGVIPRMPDTWDYPMCHWKAYNSAFDAGWNPGPYLPSKFTPKELLQLYLASGATPLLCPPKDSAGYVFMGNIKDSPDAHVEFWSRGSGDYFNLYRHAGLSLPGNRIDPEIKPLNIQNGMPQFWERGKRYDWGYDYKWFFILSY